MQLDDHNRLFFMKLDKRSFRIDCVFMNHDDGYWNHRLVGIGHRLYASQLSPEPKKKKKTVARQFCCTEK
jgi:hypothetical protein